MNKQMFLVVCNDMAHLRRAMKHYTEKFPNAVANLALDTVTVDNIVFQFVARTSNPDSLSSFRFLGIILPPGYELPNLFEVMVLPCARW